MGFITRESMEYDRFKRENKKSTAQFIYECDIAEWLHKRPRYEQFDTYAGYHFAMVQWYPKKPRLEKIGE